MNSRDKQFRIGVLGGMGPLAGVLLQKLIIEVTPAEKDQDHIQVVCFTNPQIPDRTRSLEENNGKDFSVQVKESIDLLIRTDVNVIVIACNTAHAKFEEIQKGISVPIVNLIHLTVEKIRDTYGEGTRVGILATYGLLKSGIYQDAFGKNNQYVILPNSQEQEELMEIMYAVKGGAEKGIEDRLKKIANSLMQRGARVILLGCTELSLYFQELQSSGILVEDPLRIVAKYLVGLSRERIDKISTLDKLPVYED